MIITLGEFKGTIPIHPKIILLKGLKSRNIKAKNEDTTHPPIKVILKS